MGFLDSAGKFFSSIGDAATGGLFSLATGALSGAMSSHTVSQQNKANLQLAQYQNEANKQLWYEQQAYNTPKEQLSRLKEAGLNPNLIYGSGSASATGNASAPPTMTKPEIQIFDKGTMFNNIAQNVLDTVIKSKQIEQLNANIHKTTNEALKAGEDATNAKNQNNWRWSPLVNNLFTSEFQNRVALGSTNATLAGFLLSDPFDSNHPYYSSAALQRMRWNLGSLEHQWGILASRDSLLKQFGSDDYESRIKLNQSNATLAAIRAGEILQTLPLRLAMLQLSNAGKEVQNSTNRYGTILGYPVGGFLNFGSDVIKTGKSLWNHIFNDDPFTNYLTH